MKVDTDPRARFKRQSDAERVMHQHCVAGILVGGKSRRMGQPKSLLTLQNRQTFVGQVLDVARQVVDDVVLLGDSPSLPASLSNATVIPDPVPDTGPLAGLCSLLKYANNRWALLLACDLPLISTTLLERLKDQCQPLVDAVVYVRHQEPRVYHACCGFYHPRILNLAISELNAGGRMQSLLGRIRVSDIQPDETEMQQLINVNTPGDYASVITVIQRFAR